MIINSEIIDKLKVSSTADEFLALFESETQQILNPETAVDLRALFAVKHTLDYDRIEKYEAGGWFSAKKTT
nr:hypothetical protein [Clostridia bacterium]